jgi:hypothetical protein
VPLEYQENYAERIVRLRQFVTRKRALVEDVSLEELVMLFSWMKTRNPRDAIYAYLGLAWVKGKDTVLEWQRSSQDYSLFFNYRLHQTTVFMRFVAQSIRASGSLDILCRSWSPPERVKLPSWIRNIQERGTAQDSVRVEFC